jgi:hypothetical protein
MLRVLVVAELRRLRRTPRSPVSFRLPGSNSFLGRRFSAHRLTNSEWPAIFEIAGCGLPAETRGLRGVTLTVGMHVAGGERLLLGRPRDRPQGFGTYAGLPTCASTRKKPRRTRAGVRQSGGNGGCQGTRSAASWRRASRSGTYARSSRHVQRSAACGVHSFGVVHLNVCLEKRQGCSITKRATYACHTAPRSGGHGPVPQNHSGSGV